MIPWFGGENPVPGKVVKVQYRDGNIETLESNRISWKVPWNKVDDPEGNADVIAYEIGNKSSWKLLDDDAKDNNKTLLLKTDQGEVFIGKWWDEGNMLFSTGHSWINPPIKYIDITEMIKD